MRKFPLHAFDNSETMIEKLLLMSASFHIAVQLYNLKEDNNVYLSFLEGYFLLHHIFKMK